MTQRNEGLPRRMRYSLESRLRAVLMVEEEQLGPSEVAPAWAWAGPRWTAGGGATGRRAWTVCATVPRVRTASRAG